MHTYLDIGKSTAPPTHTIATFATSGLEALATTANKITVDVSVVVVVETRSTI